MPIVAENIKSFFKSYSSSEIKNFETLPKSGGDRIYFRIITDDKSYIATYNENIKENTAFLEFTNRLRKIKAPLPEIYVVHPDKQMYLQEDFGNSSLLDKLEENGLNEYVYNLFKKSLKELAWLQIKGDKSINYNFCITSKEFGRQAIMSDLLYFKYYFLDPLKIAYDKEKLIDDFEALSTYLDHVKNKYFMFRDFQSRNIFIKNDEVHFIDYQGGMKGALQYDVASLLWQAKANLPDDWKNSLLEYYMDCVSKILNKSLDRVRFISQYNGYVLIRLLQVLGAYGFRGLFERKAHFLISIPLALTNLKWFLENKETGIALPEFERVLQLIVQDDIVDKFRPVQANEATPLIVTINSFSYLKTGYPKDVSDNGGGFVFDCRGLMNPGRFEEFKQVTGRDKPVIDFLEQQTKMPDFLNSVYNLVDIAVEDYINRGFSSLMINFGCTGGQHRSVYAADALTRHLRNKFQVKIDLHHIEQNIHEQKGF
ncbi:phosphotransferase [Ginsengibacter hankyongi]|uniref:Phosphotransferase n=1 Tax=Ginsengibacter hankyongi TaxID=2607284 RepID=A0A5J5IHA6_9BACT|nr:RNase adapter RapZ [Ginsengibacter hankyongi]KAA9039451.1 phosphotransferase [Ginsengibacter hankyongi]